MNDQDALTVLGRVFVRIYRSLGQYVLHEARPTFDLGEPTIRAAGERELADARRLAEYLVARQGSVYTGQYAIEFGDLHFLNSSWLLADWTDWQRVLLEDLQADRARLPADADEALGLLNQIIEHEKDTLAKLEQVRQDHAAT